ncbi:hypothetical protein [Nonomuraea sp. SYSU D8015]|uniref:hypothetical protein n=1 Tax=Nonomuraea sp. SYSU D8015 TaxID=2593644 RepID=UPI0016602F59|nr:hypothetical protein [Nonomuraea sp. SYSU D8015]
MAPRIDKNLVIVLDHTRFQGFGHIYAKPFVENNGFEPTGKGDLLAPGLGSRWGWERNYNWLRDLRTSAQYTIGHADGGLYGYDIHYSQPFSVQLYQAEAMVKALRKIHREMDKLKSTHGYPDSYGEYVAHFAIAIGCNRFATWQNGTRSYMWMNTAEMRTWVEGVFREAVAA